MRESLYLQIVVWFTFFQVFRRALWVSQLMMSWTRLAALDGISTDCCSSLVL